jgi:hypothetical protein
MELESLWSGNREEIKESFCHEHMQGAWKGTRKI